METNVSEAEESLLRKNRKENIISRPVLNQHYKKVRSFTEYLTEPLEIEDFVVQVAEHVSPIKWHLAHTSWFFETFLLEKALSGYKTMHPQYGYLFNSYYLQTGVPHCRNRRGTISRPTVKQVFAYRRYIDDHVLNLLERVSENEYRKWAPVIEIGLHHEQQHQELMVTDLKFMFSKNPLYPVYKKTDRPQADSVPRLNWIPFNEDLYHTGHKGNGFGYDNEFPRHKTYIHDFDLANRLVTNSEYFEFIEEGGYQEPKWWLDEGYSTIQKEGWKAPLYWRKQNGEWYSYTLNGFEKVDPNEPVTHVSYFEADAFARWRGLRLPTEHEWEAAANTLPLEGNFAERGYLHPAAFQSGNEENRIVQMFGDVWQWTQSPYAPYPGYKPLPGSLGEYNGKFMCNQYVLRGGSCATSKTHIRKTYRNFFHAHERWQFTGIRLAR